MNQKSPAAGARGPAAHRFRPAGFTAGSLGRLGNSASAPRTVEAHLAVISVSLYFLQNASVVLLPKVS